MKGSKSGLSETSVLVFRSNKCDMCELYKRKINVLMVEGDLQISD